MAKFDLVIRGGAVADGLGGDVREVDVAVAGGRIAEVGKALPAGAEEIDARGLLVTPGFVDIHTHYDGQAAWDSRLAPSSFHGVTTVVMGNCGVGFAPVRPGDRDRLIELMEGIEDIPGVVLRDGLSWDWESFADYMDILGRRRYDMDVAAMLPHAPLRVFVMGERACRLEPATEADIARMRRLAFEAARAGVVGFSTSRSLNHKSIHGEPTPSLKASADELVGIARGLAEGGAAVMELAGGLNEFDMLRRISRESGLALTFGLGQPHQAPDMWRPMLQEIEGAARDGLSMTAQVAPRPIGAIISMEGSSNPFHFSPTYKAVIASGTERERLAQLRDPAVRERVMAEVRPHLGGSVIGRFGGYERLWVQAGAIDYEPPPEDSIGSRAAKSGRAPIEVFYDELHGGEGRFVYYAVSNYAHFNLDAVRELLASPHTVPGLGDGGAHVGIISDASFPTFLMMRWAKARHADGFDLGWLVKRQTADTARLFGLTDRGVIAAGMKADLNVIDLDGLALAAPVMTHDLPAGGMRLLQRAHGYAATIVAGEVVYREGEAAGPLPGRLVRGRGAA